MSTRVPVSVRFWAKVAKGSPESCWLWKPGPGHGFGYGMFYYRGRLLTSHRMAYMLYNAEMDLPRSTLVCHNCPGGDNPLCCNPHHLFPGSSKDNTQDAVKKNRMASGDRHGRATLTNDEVRAIRWVSSLKITTQRKIARWFGTTTSTVSLILLGKQWGGVV